MGLSHVAVSLLQAALFFTLTTGVVSGKDHSKQLKEVDELIVKGRNFYKDAIKLLDAIIEESPVNQKALYKRAEVRDLLKDYHVAVHDLNVILEANSNSKQAYQLRAKIQTKVGNFADAWKDWEVLTKIYAQSTSNHEKTKKLKDAKEKARYLESLHHEEVQLQKMLKKDADSMEVNKRCVSVMQRLSKEARATDKYRLQLVECAMKAKDHDVANNELTRILTAEPQNLGAMYLKARSLHSMGATDAAMANIKRCLSLDPEHKECKSMHKSIKKYGKITDQFERYVNQGKWKSVLPTIEEALNLDSNPHNVDRLYLMRCKAHLETRMLEEGLESCTEAITMAGENNPTAWELFLLRADIHMTNGDLDKAEQDIDQAGDLAKNERRVFDSRNRLNQLKKNASRKDYYKILGVSNTAAEKEIKKAYRKLAMVHHPDKVDTSEMTDQEKEAVMQKFRDISDAYQILSDEDKRRRYDLGEDLEEEAGGGHNPFHGFREWGGGGGGGGGGFRGGGGGFKFSGGGFNFKFG